MYQDDLSIKNTNNIIDQNTNDTNSKHSNDRESANDESSECTRFTKYVSNGYNSMREYTSDSDEDGKK